ncbi:MAG: ABC transporter permease [Armatimonadetes bacterium]|nr:ABC transporter permease [Armatimonadota bacterium]
MSILGNIPDALRLFRAISIRLAYGVLSLIFVSFVTFLASELAPGDVVDLIAGEKATVETKARIRHDMGLDRPWYTRYGEFLVGATQLDFGKSYVGTKEPVKDSIMRTLPMTMRVAFWAMLLAASIGITLGTLAAIWENRWIDKWVLGLSTLGVTIPNFVLAPILVLIFALQLDRLPTTWEENRVASDFYYLVLPVVILSLRPMATLTRLARASMIDTLHQEFIRLAQAKGVPPVRLYLRHGLRNSILPVVTAIGTSFGFLLTGSFIVETAFALPGIGRLAIESIQKRDIPTIQATTLVAGVLFILVNLLVDIFQPILDPRIRESQV